jgi:hypothetical protein
VVVVLGLVLLAVLVVVVVVVAGVVAGAVPLTGAETTASAGSTTSTTTSPVLPPAATGAVLVVGAPDAVAVAVVVSPGAPVPFSLPPSISSSLSHPARPRTAIAAADEIRFRRLMEAGMFFGESFFTDVLNGMNNQRIKQSLSHAAATNCVTSLDLDRARARARDRP